VWVLFAVAVMGMLTLAGWRVRSRRRG
jgi:hypothetical protein